MHRLLDDPASPPVAAHLVVQKQVALKHARPAPTTLKTLNWSPWYRFSVGLELPADAFLPRPGVDACLLVVARRSVPLVVPWRRHLFRAFVRRAFEGRGDSVPQLRGLVGDNGFSLDLPPSMLSVRAWAGVFDTMLRITPRDRWPSPKRRC